MTATTPTGPAPDELAMAVDRVEKHLDLYRGSYTARVEYTDLRLILSRLASQEETIRADGEALKPFALAMATLSSRWLDHETLWNTALPYPIAVRDLRAARARLAARQALIPTGGEG